MNLNIVVRFIVFHTEESMSLVNAVRKTGCDITARSLKFELF